MKRRDFIFTAGLVSIFFCIYLGLYFSKEISTAGGRNNYLRAICIVRELTVDRIIIGNPDIMIRKVGTVWVPYFKTLRQAVNQGINVLIVQEPTLHDHWDLDSLKSVDLSLKRRQVIEAIERRKKWIEENELVNIRSHYVMNMIQDYGMPFALGQKLGFLNVDIIRSKDYYNVYRIEENSAINIARKIASELADFNQCGVAFSGDQERIISSIGLGTGYICDPRDYADLQPDLCIAIDDTNY